MDRSPPRNLSVSFWLDINKVGVSQIDDIVIDQVTEEALTALFNDDRIAGAKIMSINKLSELL